MRKKTQKLKKGGYQMNLKINRIIFNILAISSILFSSGCAKEADDMTNLSSNISHVTYASETGGINHNDIDAHVSNHSQYSESYFPTQTISSYSTKFNKHSIGRKNNITLAAKAINGIIVKPDEIFSFNDSVGPTSKNNGFSLAKIFIKGRESKGYGGGVCQVSSTLYNAVDNAGMEIIERHPHTKKVHYVDENRDAATSYGSVDFKFKNTYSYPVKISTLVKEGELKINLDSV